MRDLVSTVLLARADEQTAAIRLVRWQHEPDSQDVINDRRPVKWKRARCLAGDCERPVYTSSYCLMHWSRIRREGNVEGYFWDKRRAS